MILAKRAGGANKVPDVGAKNNPARQMKALLLFSKKSCEEGKSYPEDLANLINEKAGGIRAYTALFEDLLFNMGEKAVDVIDTANNLSLIDYDVVYFRYWGDSQGPAIAASRYCALSAIPFVDSEVLRTGSYNKITQYMNLYDAGIRFPKTLAASNKHLLDSYSDYGFSFPLIVKSAGGTRGKDNYAVKNKIELCQIFQSNPKLTFVMQEFIPNKGDYRVIVMGDKVVTVIKRKARAGTHLNNTSQGAASKIVPTNTLPPEVIKMSLRAARFFGRQIAGVDIVRSLSDGRYYCFEVNRAPQIERTSFQHEKAVMLSSYLRNLAR